ncbi:hypothetical protein BCR35DRAFT_307865 [Leucosporidium creatinivorum]|uniref:Uncharacterized protein n=1 Tax=Leucosporidium creatinivorum TaxID=106004 RepID=A0A1Y2EGU2_9BASI|nr:hypothetical protein BCR35DRAFT_307865 [Leucosporidium creatinivorum]
MDEAVGLLHMIPRRRRRSRRIQRVLEGCSAGRRMKRRRNWRGRECCSRARVRTGWGECIARFVPFPSPSSSSSSSSSSVYSSTLHRPIPPAFNPPSPPTSPAAPTPRSLPPTTRAPTSRSAPTTRTARLSLLILCLRMASLETFLSLRLEAVGRAQAPSLTGLEGMRERAGWRVSWRRARMEGR